MIKLQPSIAVAFSQYYLFIALLICIVINPSIVFSKNQGGLSNYGTEMPTLMVFSLGIWLCVGLLVRAKNSIESTQHKYILTLLILGYALLAISTYPYKLNVLFKNIHVVVGFMFALLQLGIALWCATITKFDKLTALGLLIMSMSLIIGIMTASQVINQLFTAQLLGGIGFAVILIHTFNQKST